MDYYLFSFILSIVGFAIALSSLSWVVYNVYFWRRRILEKEVDKCSECGTWKIGDDIDDSL